VRYALKVIQKNGDEDFVREMSGEIARFTYAGAYHKRDFLLAGIADEVQSINIVKYPKKRKAA
jgi:hypothetical protein